MYRDRPRARKKSVPQQPKFRPKSLDFFFKRRLIALIRSKSLPFFFFSLFGWQTFCFNWSCRLEIVLGVPFPNPGHNCWRNCRRRIVSVGALVPVCEVGRSMFGSTWELTTTTYWRWTGTPLTMTLRRRTAAWRCGGTRIRIQVIRRRRRPSSSRSPRHTKWVFALSS